MLEGRQVIMIVALVKHVLLGWILEACRIGQAMYAVFWAKPADSFRGSAIAIPLGRISDLLSVKVLSTGLLVILQYVEFENS